MLVCLAYEEESSLSEESCSGVKLPYSHHVRDNSSERREPSNTSCLHMIKSAMNDTPVDRVATQRGDLNRLVKDFLVDRVPKFVQLNDLRQRVNMMAHFSKMFFFFFF